jgi:serine/threonine protein kinase
MTARAEALSIWHEIEPHFSRALDLEPDEREQWLTELSSTEPRIAAAVRTMLAEHSALDAAGFLDGSAIAAGDANALVANLSSTATRAFALEPRGIIGAYRLIREIGTGGMSTVWLAERHDGSLKREVALKLPFPGPHMRVERFLRERDILATLTHPNIARLYDAGVAENGQPYLAMEYVSGTALIQSCDEQCLNVEERLRIFLQVLEAVQFAHAELVIHRDLKPSNILVTRRGRVVLLDFGIGKLLTEGTAGANDRTQFVTHMNVRPLTPQYASPEQVAGRALGTPSDIYSLGVILYELLTGTTPYAPRRDSPAALEESILVDERRRPSRSGITERAATARGTTPRSLARTLADDVDTIVLKALKRDARERYASASAFAQDIDNYLHCRPVSAQPDSHWYLFTRFAARHRVPFAAGTIAVTALIAGFTIANWQARVAAKERDRAVALAHRNEAVTDFLGRVMTEAPSSSQPLTVSELLARSEKLATADTSDSPENRAAVLEMIGDRYLSMGDAQNAARLAAMALDLVRTSPDHALRARLTCEHAMASAQLGDPDGATRAIKRELERSDIGVEAESHCLLQLAHISWETGRATDALRYAERGLARVEATQDAGADSLHALLLGAVAYGHHLNGHNAAADRYFDRAMQLYTATGHARRADALAVLNNWAVMVDAAGMPRRSLEIYERIMRIETERASNATLSSTAIGNQARALQAVGRYAEARTGYERECALADQRPQDIVDRAHCELGAASLDLETHRYDDVAPRLTRVRALLTDAGFPAESPPLRVIAELDGRLALGEGRIADARAVLDHVAIDDRPSPIGFRALLARAELDLATSNNNASADNARRALAMATSLQGDLPHSSQAGLAWLMLGRTFVASGQAAKARRAFSAAVDELSATVDPNHPALLQAKNFSRD